eukprot:scaffold13159_cov74-Cyclotella_meneghiniana.AAC.1
MSSANDSLDDENGENQPGNANVLEIDKRNEVIPPMIKPSGLVDRVSLIEHRAAMFGSVNGTQKRGWSKPNRIESDPVSIAPPAAAQTAEFSGANHGGVQDNERCKQQQKQSDMSNTSSRINANSSHDAAWVKDGIHLEVDAVCEKDCKMDEKDASGPLEFKSGHKKCSSDSATVEENSATSSNSQQSVTSPSRMDFESKKRFIFNLANSTRDTAPVKSGRFNVEESVCQNDDDDENNNADSSGPLKFKSGRTKNLVMDTAREKDYKRNDKGASGPLEFKSGSSTENLDSATVEENSATSSNARQSVTSPSRMDFESKKRFIFNLANSTCDTAPVKSGRFNVEESVCQNDDDENNADSSGPLKFKSGRTKNLSVGEIGEKDRENLDCVTSLCIDTPNKLVTTAQEQTERMPSPSSQLLKSSQMKLKTDSELNNMHSEFVNSANSTVDSPAVECSPISHPRKPTQTKFKNTYTDNLLSKLANPNESFASRFSDVHVPPKPRPSKEMKEKSTSRLSNVQSQSGFPANFSDTVTSQTKDSPALTRFLYLNNMDKPKKIIADVTTGAEAIPQTNRVFSPLTSQLITDMIGFTTSFSEAVASPREQDISEPFPFSNEFTSTADSAFENVYGTTNESHSTPNDQSLFSDFTHMNFTSLPASEVMGSHGAKNGYPFSFRCGGSTANTDSAIATVTTENHFADFRIDNECAALTADSDADKSDDLGRELDSILETPTQSQPLSTDVINEEPHAIANNVFFGARYNQELVLMDAITNSISQGSQIEETLSTIDEADEDLEAQLRLFKESLTPAPMVQFFNQINQMFDRKIENLEKKVKSAAVENSVINEEMCHQHRQIQSLMTQNQNLVLEIEKLKKTADVSRSNSWVRFKKKAKLKKHWI